MRTLSHAGQAHVWFLQVTIEGPKTKGDGSRVQAPVGLYAVHSRGTPPSRLLCPGEAPSLKLSLKGEKEGSGILDKTAVQLWTPELLLMPLRGWGHKRNAGSWGLPRQPACL